MDQARAMARMVCKGPTTALAMTKAMLNRSFELDYGASALMESHAQGISMATSYHKQAVATFLKREPPNYNWDSAWSARPKPG